MKIDKNIPIPALRERASLIHKMQVGDSVFVTGRQEMAAMRQAIIVSGFKPVSRKEQQGWRVWKTQRT